MKVLHFSLGTSYGVASSISNINPGKEVLIMAKQIILYNFIAILDVTSKEEWMKDVASENYQKDFFPKFFGNWGADFYVILGDEVYHGESD
jgi:hypothetical protein